MKGSMLYMVFIAGLLAMLPVNTYGSPSNNDSVMIVIEPVFNGAPLRLADQYYVNAHGDTLFIDLFRFYITNLQLRSDKTVSKDVNSHWVDAEVTSSCRFAVSNLADGNYTSVHFTLGVDSVTNTNGANGGDLDPSLGMYWAWNSGYIMAKMEGRSNVCKTRHHAFEFHIGGYMPPYNAAREVNIVLPEAAVAKSGGKMVIHIKADAAVWFSGVDLSRQNSIMIPGKEACAVADRYVKMFTAGTVINE